MDMTQYYDDIKKVRAELSEKFKDGFLYVMSVQNRTGNTKGGVVSQVSVEIGARNVVEGTHRVATPEEIAAFTKAQATERDRIKSDLVERTRAQFAYLMDTVGSSQDTKRKG